MAAWSNADRFAWVGPEWDYQPEPGEPIRIDTSALAAADPGFNAAITRFQEQLRNSLTTPPIQFKA